MSEPTFDLPKDAILVGVARCSEASPQCLAVTRNDQGDITLINQVGGRLQIPAGEVMATAALMLKTAETHP